MYFNSTMSACRGMVTREGNPAGESTRRTRALGLKALPVALGVFWLVVPLPSMAAGSKDKAPTSPAVHKQVRRATPPVKQRSVKPSISSDGRFIVFQSTARRIIPDDTNDREDVFLYDTQTSRTTRISIDSKGNQANADSYNAVISADGNFVAFVSDATNLVASDTNGKEDIFVYDVRNHKTSLVSVDSSGRQGNGESRDPVISGDGRYVAFVSVATNLVADDTNASADVFVRDRQTGTTTRASAGNGGSEAAGGSGEPAISADGRYVAFYSHAANLVANDSNKQADIFVHDMISRMTTCASISPKAGQGNGESRRPDVSADGRFVAFESWATNLVPGDKNRVADIFVHDLKSGTTSRVSVDSSGKEGNGESRAPNISTDGRYVVFTSYAENLVADDANRRSDVFIRDTTKNQTTRISVDSAGAQANNHSAEARITADGRFVVFATKSSNLVPDDANKSVDIVLRDRQAGKTVGITVESTRRTP